MPTFSRRLMRNLPSNFPEWVCSIMVLALGIIWLTFPGSLFRPEHATFLEIAPARTWIAVTLLSGVASCLAVAAYTEAPRFAGVIRTFMAVMRVTFFGACVGRSLASSDWFSMSSGVILWGAFFVLDVRSVSVASVQMFNAFRRVRCVVHTMVR